MNALWPKVYEGMQLSPIGHCVQPDKRHLRIQQGVFAIHPQMGLASPTVRVTFEHGLIFKLLAQSLGVFHEHHNLRLGLLNPLGHLLDFAIARKQIGME